VLHYQENDNNNNNNNNNKLHHKVAQEALRLRCVRSVCCGVHLHKRLKSWDGILWCGFSFKCFNLLPSATVSHLIYIVALPVSVTLPHWSLMDRHKMARKDKT
jgi:hypothetical protein